MTHIYLDYNASTPIAPEVKQVMMPFLENYYGNPSALHFASTTAKRAVEEARLQVANLIHCSPSEIIFTSGGSESNNHVLKSTFYGLREKGNHIITTTVEHPAILNVCKFLESVGAKVTYVGVDSFGRVNPKEIEEAITSETILISVMHANNEVGTVQPLKEIGKIAKKHEILFHTDAAQSVGKLAIDVKDLDVDFLTIAGHKLYAPKGVGALYIREGITIEPLIHGAGHEDGRRAGTENVLLVVGLGKSCELAAENITYNEKIKELRDYFWTELKQYFGENVSLNGHERERLPNTLNINFENRIGQDILSAIPQIAASTGSACHSGIVHLSPVLKAMGITEDIGKGAVRFSLGKYTTKEELEEAISLIKRVLNNDGSFKS